MTSAPETPGSPIDRLMRSLSGKHLPSLAKPVSTPAQDPLPVAEETLETPDAVAPEGLPEVSTEVPAEEPAPAAETSPTAGADKFHPFDRLKAQFKKATLLLPAQALDGKAPVPINDGDADDYDDPPTLAERIRALIDSLPSPTPRSSRTLPKFPKATPIPRDANGRPIPPPGAIPIKDQKLIKRLFSPAIMNAENRSGDSIWSILSNYRHDDTEAGPSGDGGHDTDSTHSGGSRAFSDNSSIMMYSPLIPKKDDLVEIADSEVVPAPSSSSLQLPIDHAIQAPPQVFKWPWSKKPGIAPAPTPTSGGDKKDGDTQPDETPTPTPSLPPIEHRIWIPSTTKLSCEITWWGYRLYLPPPILAILSDKQLEATKRAAMITTALTWLFSNLPVSAFPLPMQPALLLFQKLVPYVGYIGTFISWSWSTVKSYDVGYGVILSATWLLPVALLPGTWREADWPGDKKTPASGTAPPAPSSPAPGPSAPVPTVPVAAPVVPPGMGISISDDQGSSSATPSKIAQGIASAAPSKIDREPLSTTPSKIDKAVETVPDPSEETPATSTPAAPGTDKASPGAWWKYIKGSG